MFHGTFPQTIDSKGRVSIPAKFREVLNHLKNQHIMMTHFTMDGFNCIDVYPIAEWELLAEKIQNQHQFDPNVVWFQTFYIGGACDYEVDPQGRILIPPALREEAGLKRNIVVSGALKKFRIFDRDAYDLAKANAKEKLMTDPNQLKNLGF